ncbi:MAG: hypothetical protein WA783_19255 [Phormidesmis sp.]
MFGHTQRAVTSSPLDRILPSAFGVAAAELIANEQYDRMVTWQERAVKSVPIAAAVKDYDK